MPLKQYTTAQSFAKGTSDAVRTAETEGNMDSKRGRKDSVRVSEGEQVRVTEEALGKRIKKKHKFDKIAGEPWSSRKGHSVQENPKEALSGSGETVIARETKPGKILNGFDETVSTLNASGKIAEKQKKWLHGSDETVSARNAKQEGSAETTSARNLKQEKRLDSFDNAKQENWANGPEETITGRQAKHEKRRHQDVSEQNKPMKRQKISKEDSLKEHRMSGPTKKTLHSQAADHIQVGDGDQKKAKVGAKRKKEDSIETRYEKRLRVSDDPSPISEEPTPTPAKKKEEKTKREDTGALSKKRKRGEAVETMKTRTYDDEEKLKRTVFVGNLPLKVSKKTIVKEFSQYGSVESVRLRSVPLLDTKIPRKGAIIKGQVNEAINSQHAYIVFEEASHANAALAHNMEEFNGNHIRVDAAHAPHGTVKGNSALSYDHTRSIFVGNIPFDVKDEELYQTFGAGKSPEMGIEAVRVVRDPQTSLSKGIAFVLFKTKAGVSHVLSSKHNVKLRDRILRISRVLASQNVQKQSRPSERVRKSKDDDSNQLQRKRAKLSASYEGIRATKEGGRLGNGTPKTSSRSSQIKPSNDRGQPHINMKEQVGLKKEGYKSAARLVGAKRKRVEKHQRGISRSKKIRRT